MDVEKMEDTLRHSTDLQHEYKGEPSYYMKSSLHAALFLVASVLSLGILPIICSWYPQIFTVIARKRLPRHQSITTSDFVLLKDADNVYKEERIQKLSFRDTDAIIYFEYRKNRYWGPHSTTIIHPHD
jgi:hypothetical protein